MTLAHFEDLTEINVPFGLLDGDTKERFGIFKSGGGDVQIFLNNQWMQHYKELLSPDFTYRAKPGPVVTTSESKLSVWPDGNACPGPVAYGENVLGILKTTLHDGKPVKGTWEASE